MRYNRSEFLNEVARLGTNYLNPVLLPLTNNIPYILYGSKDGDIRPTFVSCIIQGTKKLGEDIVVRVRPVDHAGTESFWVNYLWLVEQSSAAIKDWQQRAKAYRLVAQWMAEKSVKSRLAKARVYWDRLPLKNRKHVISHCIPGSTGQHLLSAPSKYDKLRWSVFDKEECKGFCYGVASVTFGIYDYAVD